MSEINESGRGEINEIREVHEISQSEEPAKEGKKKIMVDIICSYCEKVLGQKESLEHKASHAVCPDCYKRITEELDKEVI